MDHRLSTFAVLLGTLLCGCTGQTVDVDAEGEALMQRSRDWSARVATGDLDTIMEPWTDGAIMMPPDLPPLEGKPAIRSYVETALQTPVFQISWEPETVYVAPSGELAYMIERNVTTYNDSLGNPVTVHGKGVTIWQKDADGSWKNVVDIWNEAQPPGN